MFSLKHTLLILSAIALSATAVELAAQDQQQQGLPRQQRQEQRRQRRQEAGAVRREIVDGLETPRRERPQQREDVRQGRRGNRQAQMAANGAQSAAAQSGEVKPIGEYKPVDNPVFKHKYTADPAPVVIGDTLWLITSHDHTAENGRPNPNYTMKDWCLFSTKDMKTWTEWPAPIPVSDFKWDTTHTAYAAQMIARNGKYYLYTSTNGAGIGVAVADKPEGPYKDAIGKQLVKPEDCFATQHSWACIDPTVLIDDDGQAYLIWGNGHCYYAKLKENMIELDGPVKSLDVDWKQYRFTEGPWIHKYNGKYYLTYASGFMPERIAYAMADSIDGHFEAKGILCEGNKNTSTNHPGIAQFNGQWYFFYHDGTLPGGGSYNRSVCIDKLEYNADGTMKPIVMTKDGIFSGNSAASGGGTMTNPVDVKTTGNPLFKDVWTADPAALVVGDTLYLYAGHDDAHGREMFTIKAWRAYSTKDLVNWKSYGDVLTSTDFPYGQKNTCWAAQVVKKGDTYYWYVTIRNDKYGGQSINVATSDKPIGPWKTYEKPVVTDNLTNGFMGWNDIDPTCLIDDDGTAWLCWGNGNCYLAKLKDNMLELDGEITDLKMQSYEEGPWLYKRNGLYYCIYASRPYLDEANHKQPQGSEVIAYATAEKITGPWTYRGQVTGTARNSFTIHPAVVDFKGRTFLFYHNAALSINGEGGALGRRAVCVDEMFFNEDGTIKPVRQTNEGIQEPVK